MFHETIKVGIITIRFKIQQFRRKIKKFEGMGIMLTEFIKSIIFAINYIQ